MRSFSRPNVLILAQNADRARAWAEQLQEAAACVWLSATEVAPGAVVEIVVSDHPAPGGEVQSASTTGAGIIGIGDVDTADVRLSPDASAGELRLACVLLAEIVRLRAETNRMAHVRDETQRLAHTDPLTGLPNRRAWDRRLPQVQRAAGSTGQGVWLAILDLDRLKRANEAGGLALGDEALRIAAQAMAAALRRDDLIARLGGDEFGVLLAGVDEPGALAVLERLRAAVSTADVRPGGERMTVSIGYAPAAQGNAAPVDLFAAAERGLREAKQSGGDRTVRGNVEDR
jgi:diguanylate cyclase (GGDEF)-like protein